eukprot:gnl/TRDRNA2_/TRDRNA2_163196_c0_seq5.p1 gnl/TRDRNA2_/TRDRNA2_163196_c0~~gnl/TRDRNA2_/TRDRNA2_163196_c0_seq5.p1  ORF type:complete len:498 (+),score=70.83 gnl/TRDRNA2_/TRDRNA2_163196_c0_seq5:130-1623(+)
MGQRAVCEAEPTCQPDVDCRPPCSVSDPTKDTVKVHTAFRGFGNNSQVPEYLSVVASQVPAQPGTRLHICCCALPWIGHLMPMLRMARALADRPSVGRVSFVTDVFGASKVQAWLSMDPDRTGKIKVVDFQDGYDKVTDDEIHRLQEDEDERPVLRINATIEAKVGSTLQRLVREEKAHYFVVDWASYGFTGHLRNLGAKFCISMPGSTLLAQYLHKIVHHDKPMKIWLLYELLRNLKWANHSQQYEDRHWNCPVLIHSFPGLGPPCSLPPYLIEVGLLAAPSMGLQVPKAALAFLEWPGPPVVYVSTGTFTAFSKAQLERFAEGLKAPGEWRVMWSLRDELQVQLPIDLGDDFFISTWLPQAEILAHPKCAAALLHCGWGATCEALASGKPVVAFPLMGDQKPNALHLSDMGMCKVIGLSRGETVLDFSPLKTFTAYDIRTDLRDVLNDPSYAKSAKHWQGISRSWGGPDYASEVIERLCYYGDAHLLFTSKAYRR